MTVATKMATQSCATLTTAYSARSSIWRVRSTLESSCSACMGAMPESLWIRPWAIGNTMGEGVGHPLPCFTGPNSVSASTDPSFSTSGLASAMN